MVGNTDPRERQVFLRKLLAEGRISTQEELADELRRHHFDITQSTISRDLRKIGAVKTVDATGNTVYRLSMDRPVPTPLRTTGFKDLLLDIQHNGFMIVIHTTAGSASLVAAHFDQIKIGGILGTIAGDDTIFIAPASPSEIESIIQKIKDSF
jgi:transcriptional regulator of arginine metabolism